jgi:7-cyano-7-deazaguanine synthase
MWIDKAQTWQMAFDLGQSSGQPDGGQRLVDVIIEHSHTCYVGDRSHRHDWGYGCGDCPACELRARGFVSWSESRAR